MLYYAGILIIFVAMFRIFAVILAQILTNGKYIIAVFVHCLLRFIARLEEQIHEWKLNTVVQGPPLTKVSLIGIFYLLII